MLVLLFFIFMLWYPKGEGAVSNTEVLENMSLSYGKTLYPCLDELHLGQDVLTDFLYYWKTDYQFTKREVGCAVICVKEKLNLLDNSGNLSKPNAEAWVKSAGGDDNMAKYVTYLYMSCQKVANTTGSCEKALEVTNCFRDAVQRAQSSPNVPVVVKRSDEISMIYLKADTEALQRLAVNQSVYNVKQQALWLWHSLN